MASYIVLILLFVLPFIVGPFGLSFYEIPKVFVAEFFLLLLAFISVWTGKRDSIFRKDIYTYTLLGIIALSLIHSVMYPSNLVWFGNTARFQGAVLYVFLVLWAIFSSGIAIRNKGIYAIFSLVLLACTAFILPVSMDGRIVSTIGEPNAFAAEVLFLWPFIFFLDVRPQQKRLITIGVFVLAFLLVMLSGSRSALIGISIQGLFYIISKKIPLKTAVLVSVILLGLSLVLPFYDAVSAQDSRTEIWATAMHAGIAHPVIGGGIGSLELQLARGATELTNGLRFNYVDSAHNIFLDWWVQGGVTGLLLIAVIMGCTVMRFIRRRQLTYLMMFFGLVSVLLFNPASIITLVAFWWLIGQAGAPDRRIMI